MPLYNKIFFEIFKICDKSLIAWRLSFCVRQLSGN